MGGVTQTEVGVSYYFLVSALKEPVRTRYKPPDFQPWWGLKELERRSRVQIVETSATAIASPRFIVGVPEAGLVGLIATSYVVQQLKLPEVGHVDSELLPQVVVIHESEPKSPIRIFGSESEHLIVVLSEIPLAPRFSYEFANELTNWAKSKSAEMIVGVTGIPSKNRMDSEKEVKPSVFGVSNSKTLADEMKRLGVPFFEEGMITGTHATIIKRGMALQLPSLILLVESYAEFPDPEAAASSIEVLRSLLAIKVDTKPLIEESEGIRIRTRDLMRRTQQSMQPTSEAPSVYA